MILTPSELRNIVGSNYSRGKSVDVPKEQRKAICHIEPCETLHLYQTKTRTLQETSCFFHLAISNSRASVFTVSGIPLATPFQQNLRHFTTLRCSGKKGSLTWTHNQNIRDVSHDPDHAIKLSLAPNLKPHTKYRFVQQGCACAKLLNSGLCALEKKSATNSHDHRDNGTIIINDTSGHLIG